MVLLVLFALAANAAQAPAGMPRAQRHESRHEIDRLEQIWAHALVHRNVGELESLLAEDYIAIMPSGNLQTKDEALDSLKAGSVQIATLDLSDRKVRFYGQTALVTSRAAVTGKTAGRDISGSYRYTRVYVKDARGRWRIVSFEANKIRELGEREHR